MFYYLRGVQLRMMYYSLVVLHSIFRWLVLLSLVYAIFRACIGYSRSAIFNRTDNAIRHWTATIGHLQLVIGIVLYTQSPVVKSFFVNMKEGHANSEGAFFGLIHSTLMFAAIVVLTIGSALAKRRQVDKHKFRTMLVWFTVALIIILIAIPWPFSPLANRPYLR